MMSHAGAQIYLRKYLSFLVAFLGEFALWSIQTKRICLAGQSRAKRMEQRNSTETDPIVLTLLHLFSTIINVKIYDIL